MPGMKGDRFIRTLRDIPGYKSSMIVAITIHEEQEILDLLKIAGADYVLTKPIDEIQLYRLLSGVEYG